MAPWPGGFVSRVSASAPRVIRKSSRRRDADILLSETNASKNVASTSSAANARSLAFGRHWKNKTVPSSESLSKNSVKNGDAKKIKGKTRPGENSQANMNNSTSKSSIKGQNTKAKVPLTEAERQAARRNWQRIGKLVIESLGPQTKKSRVTQAGKNSAPKLLERLAKPLPEITERELWLMSKIPGVPVWVAAICFVCNFFVPGLGTMVSAWSLLCCGYMRRDHKVNEIMNLICINMWIAMCQLMTVTFCLVGWFWSVFWGIKLIQKATVLARQKSQHDAELRDMTTKAFRDNMLRLVDTTRIV